MPWKGNSVLPRLKVAYIFTGTHLGGAEKVCLNFLKYVDRYRFYVSPVVLIRPWESENYIITTLKSEHYTVFKIPIALHHRKRNSGYLRVVRSYRILSSFLAQGSFDLVHTHGYFADIIGIAASKIIGMPCISTCHGFISNDLKLKFYNTLDCFALRFCKRIIADSENIKKNLVRSGIRQSGITVIPNAVPEAQRTKTFNADREKKRQSLNIHDKEFVLGYIGRLSPEKGVVHLIEAGTILAKSGIPVKILLIGEGSQVEELKTLARNKKFASDVIFTGFQHDIENWLPAMDVFILPSFTEGTPLALLEAMSCEIPVIATCVGGIPQLIVNGFNGILVTPGKADELAQATKRIFCDLSYKRNIVKNASRFVREKHNIYAWCRKIEGEYENLKLY